MTCCLRFISAVNILILSYIQPAFAEQPIVFHGKELIVEDTYLWRIIPLTENTQYNTPLSRVNQLKLDYNKLPLLESIGGKSGAYIAKLVLQNKSDNEALFLTVNSNFVDLGYVHYTNQEQNISQLKDFSQLTDDSLPRLLHYQAVDIHIQKNTEVELWLLISADKFATPVSITISGPEDFYQYQNLNNALSIAGITTMLVLALLAALVYVGTRKIVSISCAGYLGLHGIGWAAASGLIDDTLNLSINSTYWGILIFPYAIACASQFVCALFDCKLNHKKLYKFLRYLSIGAVLVGIVNCLIPFTYAFWLSHILASFWVVVTLTVAVFMLKKRDYRAKYFLLGNLLYSASLAYYIAAHSQFFGALAYSESVVVVALSIDCICILLCLSEWFRLKRVDFDKHQYLSRIDVMTQLGNRFALNESVTNLEEFYVVVYVDLDGLKMVNDKKGHQEGDKLIIKTANLMKQSLSAYGGVYRSGGDEFIALLNSHSVAETEELEAKAWRIMETLSAELGRTWQWAGLSFGIATSLEESSVYDCISLADKRMYTYKASNKES
ncbi:GGDEF domain-containing protein [Glaciecola sp. 2405UD65-10]|uniref:GGDEF domain-containing protein n=1 Tax=Glaciecola sp. 2405UD65-10 TaxID=3397244 RepID=UPI003B5C5698